MIAEGQPDRVMIAFMEPMNRKVLHSMPPATFAEVLYLLSPKYFVEPYKEMHERLWNTSAGAKRMKHVRSIFSQFSKNLIEIVEARRASGHKLGVAEYTRVLDCARSMGFAEMADMTWEHMAFDSVEPNLECYNYYMEAKAWHDAYFVKQSHRHRAIPWNYRHRWYFERSGRWTGYRTGEGGVQDQVRAIFKEMTDTGLEPDTTSYIQLMTASSRNMDLETVKGILRTVWNIDVEVLTQDPSDHPPVTQYSPSSHLFPSANLLYAIAHIFCSNNEFVTALKLVDFFSIAYDTPIPQRAWKELLVWSFILSNKKRGRNSLEETVGIIPKNSILAVHTTMTDEYNMAPFLRATDILAKTGWTRQTCDKMMLEMRVGRDMLFEIISKRDNAKKFFEDLAPAAAELRPDLSTRPTSKRPYYQYIDLNIYRDLIPKSAFDDGLHWHAFHEFQTQQMAAMRASIYIERWVRLLLSRNKWSGDPYWYERTRVPDIITEWKHFLPVQVFYQTTGGQVEFDMETVWPEGKRTRPAHLTPLPLAQQGKFHVGELTVTNTRDIPQAAREWAWIREKRWVEDVKTRRLAQPNYAPGQYPDLKPTWARPQVTFEKTDRPFVRRARRDMGPGQSYAYQQYDTPRSEE